MIPYCQIVLLLLKIASVIFKMFTFCPLEQPNNLLLKLLMFQTFLYMYVDLIKSHNMTEGTHCMQ